MRKIYFIISSLLISSFSFAEEPKNFDIQKVKTLMTKQIDAKIFILNEEKKCIESSKSKEDLQVCMELSIKIHNDFKNQK